MRLRDIIFTLILVKAAFLTGLLACLLCTCSYEVAGGSTETTNSKVIGNLYFQDGTFATKVDVYMRQKTSLPDTALLAVTRKYIDTSYTTTDDSGRFEIDTIDTGAYIIEGNDGTGNFFLIDSVFIDASDSTVRVSDTLMPPGSITGTVYLSEGGDPRKVFILAFGLNRIILPDSGGNFVFDNLAEAFYNLRLLPSLPDYGVLDTFNIRVISNAITDLDTIELPYIGIPIPKNLSSSYDTLRQIATLRWSKQDPYNMVKGYNVYRRHIDSSFTNDPLNPILIPDTTYNDSSARQDQTYEYKITAVDTGDNDGKMSSGVTVFIACAFELIDSLGSQGTGDGQFTTIWDMCFDKNGNLYVVSHEPNTGDNPRIQKFDSNNNFLMGFGQKGSGNGQFMRPIGIDVDDSLNIYIADAGNGRIQKFDSNGSFITSFSGNVSDTSKLDEPIAICVYNNEIYVADYSNTELFSTVKKFSSNGNFILKWGKKGNGDGEFSKILSINSTDNGEIVTLDENRLQFFTNSGMFIKKISLSDYRNFIEDFVISDSIIYSVLSNEEIGLLDYYGECKGILHIYNNDISQITAKNNTIYISFFDLHTIKIFQKK